MTLSFSRQLFLQVRQGLKNEFADKERIITPVLFAVTILLLFSFAIGHVDPSLELQVYLAQTFLAVFLALQVSFVRIFEPDREDRVFDVMRTYPLSYPAWFLAKYCLVLVMGILTVAPTMVCASVFIGSVGSGLLTWAGCAVALLALIGLTALGVLVSGITMKAHGRQMLFPILYFPLSAPVLLASVNALAVGLQTGNWGGDAFSWLGLLVGFDVIYFTLGILLFSEIVDSA